MRRNSRNYSIAEFGYVIDSKHTVFYKGIVYSPIISGLSDSADRNPRYVLLVEDIKMSEDGRKESVEKTFIFDNNWEKVISEIPKIE